MTLEQRDYILRCIGRTDGDDLERANMAFGNATDEQLDAPYGQSGKTARQIWDDYKDRRAKHVAAYAALQELLHV